MSEQRKTRSSAATPEREGNAKDTTNDQRKSHSHFTADQKQKQAGYISQFLSAGAGQGLHLQDLVRITRLSEREVRQMIQAERLRGIPILADNKSGYYLPSNDAEKAAFVQSMRHRADEIHRAAEAVNKAVVDWTY